MILGAFIDAGVPLKKLNKELSRLPVKGYKLIVKKVKRAGLLSTKVDINVSASRVTPHVSRKFKDVENIIKKSTLSKNIKQKGLKIFKRLFEAEAEVHGGTFQKIHLHELGAVDCIIDIFGTLICLDILCIQHIYASSVNLGNGSVQTEHGILPVPAPATAKLLEGIPVYSTESNFELTTPTGALLITSLAEGFGPMPEMKISKTGIGAGNKNFKNKPNVLRVFIGDLVPNDTGQAPQSSGIPKHRDLRCSSTGSIQNENIVTVIETNIDDMNPQIYEYVMKKLFKAGALDVFLEQVIMKRGRPGVKLTVLCVDEKKEDLMKILLGETTTIGLRFYDVKRRTLEREIRAVKTKFGKINVKISKLGKDILKSTPEYRECRKIAKKHNIPLIDVYKEVVSKSQDLRFDTTSRK